MLPSIGIWMCTKSWSSHCLTCIASHASNALPPRQWHCEHSGRLAVHPFLVSVGVKAKDQPRDWHVLPDLQFRVIFWQNVLEKMAEVIIYLEKVKRYSILIYIICYYILFTFKILAKLTMHRALDNIGTVRRPLVSPWKEAKAMSGPLRTCTMCWNLIPEVTRKTTPLPHFPKMVAAWHLCLSELEQLHQIATAWNVSSTHFNSISPCQQSLSPHMVHMVL